MWMVILFLFLLIALYVIVEGLNGKRKESKGICKTTGGMCTSPSGCTCHDSIAHEDED